MRLVEHFFRIIAPSNCLKCGSEGSLLCLWCREEALPEGDSRCYRCNTLTKDSATCLACRRHSKVRHLWVRTEYTEHARALVHAMKFKYSGEAADLIAQELAGTIPALPPETVIVHVPTITSHVRERGFDHARRIAAGLAKRSELRLVPAMGRTGQLRQVGSSRQVRLKQQIESFRLRAPFLVSGCSVLLVDDVLTTGATIEAAALALRSAGAKSVDAVVFARAK